MRFEPSLPVPVSPRLRHADDDDFVDEIVVDAVDSPLLVVRLVRVVTDGDAVVVDILELRGKLSIEDCDDAIIYSINIYRHNTMGCYPQKHLLLCCIRWYRRKLSSKFLETWTPFDFITLGCSISLYEFCWCSCC
jgi:hypothetical protein